MSDIAKGEQISLAFKYINQLFNECQRLIFKIDNHMAPEWNNLRSNGNRITKEVSSSLQEPDRWMLDTIFRFYEGDEDKSVNKCITITFWGDEVEVEQPVITAGKILYSDIDQRHHWDLWRLWFQWDDTNEINEYVLDGKINIIQSEDCKHITEAHVFSWPLVSITDEETLIEKIIKPLKEL